MRLTGSQLYLPQEPMKNERAMKRIKSKKRGHQKKR